jgi:protein ImuB
MPRLVCLVVPLFPLAARLRAEPELVPEAVIVCAGQGNGARVVAASRRARKAGIRVGHTLPQARALQPKVIARGRDPICERSAQEALYEVGEAASPRVEDAGEGVIYIELGSPEELARRGTGGSRNVDHGGGSRTADEISVALGLEIAAKNAGLEARAGVASSKLAARVAASTPRKEGAPLVVVPEGEEAQYLAPLPLHRLTPEIELAEMLDRWGLRSIGDFAKLPAAEVVSRLGGEGHKLHAVARGLDPQPLVPRQPPLEFEEGLDCEWPLVSLEPLIFLGRAALDRLAKRLEARGLGCVRLTAELRLEPEGWATRTIDLPAPTRDVKTLVALLKIELEERPPGAPVTGFRFAATPDRPRDSQLTLLGPSDLSPDRLATTLARLFALLGAGRVGSPGLPDGHRPERFALLPFGKRISDMPSGDVREARALFGTVDGQPSAMTLGSWPRLSGRGLLSIRAFRPPIEVEVRVEPDTARGLERPFAVAPLAGEATKDRPKVEGAVRVASGPWSMEEGWWTSDAVRREYWDVELAGGGLYRLFRDLASAKWFADGLYD